MTYIEVLGLSCALMRHRARFVLRLPIGRGLATVGAAEVVRMRFGYIEACKAALLTWENNHSAIQAHDSKR